MRLLTRITVYATLLLIFAGSLVTSTGSGLAVPDWPLSYGMVFPPMVGGVLYEHGHRMVAAVVALLVLVQAVVLSRHERRSWLCWLAWIAVASIVIQGILGGLTVLWLLPTSVSVMHGMLAQTLLLLLILIAYAQSREWKKRQRLASRDSSWRLVMALPIVLYLQLLLGALMRHTDSGLAIPDFPLIGGSVFPVFNERMMATINADRFALLLEPVKQGQVLIHFLHRVWAIAILAVVIFINAALRIRSTTSSILSILWLVNVLVLTQVTLGALTVLTARSVLITSLHVLIGAALLGVSLLCLLRSIPIGGSDRGIT